MNPVAFWWERVCQPLDGYLWQRDISHPVIRPVLRNAIFAGCLLLLAGAALYGAFPWLFWLAAGFAAMIWVFWSWAALFSRGLPASFGKALLKSVVLRFYLRLIAFAALLYLALAVFKTPAEAIVAGVFGGAIFIAACYFAYLRKIY